ncbi:MAG TPA: AraC family transcriptional regulator [Mucilaginibacter sp.]|jgi:YesN/AraC family two-component response regulator
MRERQINIPMPVVLNGFEEKSFRESEIEHLVDRSILFMTANVHKRLSVDELASEFCYSPSRYTVLFKQKTGLSPMDYFIKIKIQQACQFLVNSDLFVKEIAGKVGYDDPYYFSRIFKKVAGKGPMEYKYNQKMAASPMVQSLMQELKLKSA